MTTAQDPRRSTESLTTRRPAASRTAAAPAPRAARHAAHATASPGQLALRNLLRGRPQYTLMLLSDYGRAIMSSKYDAFTTDLAYVKTPSGKLGPVGGLIDRLVLNVDLHTDLRDRLSIVTGELARAVSERHAAGRSPVRLLTVPSGLCRDLIGAVTTLRAAQPEAAVALEPWALDLDERGDVLPEAARRCRAAGFEVRLCREDVMNSRAVRAALRDGRRFDVVSCIGLTPWLTPAEVERLVTFLTAQVLAPGGTLIIDNFSRHSTSHTGAHLEIVTHYHDPAVLAGVFGRAGLEPLRQQTTARGVNTVYTLRKPAVGSRQPASRFSHA
jgi:hypothetical protein